MNMQKLRIIQSYFFVEAESAQIVARASKYPWGGPEVIRHQICRNHGPETQNFIILLLFLMF